MGRRVLVVVAILAMSGCVDDDTDSAPQPPAELDDSGQRIELEPQTLRVMTFNVWLGGSLVDIGQVVAAIEAADADVVGLQESDGNARRIADLLGWAHADEQRQIISRHPLIDPGNGAGYTYVQLAPGQVLAMANIHLPSDPYGPYLVRDGEPLDAVLANEADTRVSAFDDLATGWTGAFDDEIPLLLTGDFNTPSHRDWTDDVVGDRSQIEYAVDWPVSHRAEDLGFVDTFREVHPDPQTTPGITWTLGYPYPRLLEGEAQDRIDFVYAAGADEVVDSQVVGPTGGDGVSIGVDPYPSDHLGVVSTVVVDPAEPPLFVSPAAVRTEVGQPLGIYYHAPNGYETDRIVLVPVGGDPAADGFAMLDTAEAGFHGRITLGTAGQSPGQYEAVLLTADADGNMSEVARSAFWLVAPGAAPAVSVASATVAAGEPIEVAWSDTFARKFDWIGIFDATDPDLYNYWGFAYTEATVDGTYTFGPDDLGDEMLPPGDYVVRLMSDDSYVTIAEADFSVAG